MGDPYLIAGARVVGANAMFVRGDEEAERLVAEVADAFQRLGSSRYFREALLLLAQVRLARKDFAILHESNTCVGHEFAFNKEAVAEGSCLSVGAFN